MSAENTQVTLDGNPTPDAGRGDRPDNNLALPGSFLKQADPDTDVSELGDAYSKWLSDRGGLA